MNEAFTPMPERPSILQRCPSCNYEYVRRQHQPRRYRILLLPLWRLGGKPEALETRHFCWSVWRQDSTRTHWLLAGLALASALCINYLFLSEFPVLRLSVLRVILIGIAILSGQSAIVAFHEQIDPGLMSESTTRIIAIALIGAGMMFIALFSLLKQILPELVLHEEQAFREGAESWSRTKQMRMALYFGLAHLSNFWYPLSACLTIAIFGAILNGIYRYHCRQRGRDIAIHEVTMLHLTYDFLALNLLRIMCVAMIALGVFMLI